ncbi:MAG: CHRD domain-containing protein [Halopseudomonas sp.]
MKIAIPAFYNTTIRGSIIALPLSLIFGLSPLVLAGERSEDLLGANEVPPVISPGEGDFKARFKNDKIEFKLKYEELDTGGSDVTQAHIHIGLPSNTGGITVFLCTNLGNNPANATLRSCPASPGEVEGEIVEADVLAVGNIIQAGDLEGLKRLIEDGATYINVHSDDHPPGEIRGQVNSRKR